MDDIKLTHDELVRLIDEATREHHPSGAVGKHRCWKRRLCFTVVVIGGCVAVGHLEGWEPLTRGWEFIAAATVDKLIFGIAEV